MPPITHGQHVHPEAQQFIDAWMHAAAATSAPTGSLLSRGRRLIARVVEAAREFVAAAPAAPVAPASYMPTHAAPPSYPMVATAMREMLPVNSVAYMCPDCKALHPSSDRFGSTPLPYKIKPGERRQVTARPQRVAFRPERLTIEHAECWIVHDFKIGNRSQFAQAGDIPGSVFDARIADGTLSFETAQTAMDVTFDVTYLGPVAEGAQFLATVTGTAAI